MIMTYIHYVPGKISIIADCLSRSLLLNEGIEDELCYDTDAFVNFIVKSYPIRDLHLEEIMKAQTSDETCVKLKMYCIDGWPEKNKIPKELSSYYQYRTDINFAEDLLLKRTRIVIPAEMQEQVLKAINSGHQGIVKYRPRTKESVWWLGLSSQIEKLFRNFPKLYRGTC